MSITNTIFRSLALPAAAALMMSTAGAQAAVVESYVLEVEGGLSSVDFGSAYSVHNRSGQFRRHNNVSYRNANRLTVNDAEWAQHLGATSGALQIDVEDDGSVNYANCSGMLSMMCSSGDHFLDYGSESLVSTDSASFLAMLDAQSFVYIDDDSYTWERGHRSFFQAGYGVSVEYDISSTTLSAVPLPAGMALLMGGLGMLLGFRRRSNG